MLVLLLLRLLLVMFDSSQLMEFDVDWNKRLAENSLTTKTTCEKGFKKKKAFMNILKVQSSTAFAISLILPEQGLTTTVLMALE